MTYDPPGRATMIINFLTNYPTPTISLAIILNVYDGVVGSLLFLISTIYLPHDLLLGNSRLFISQLSPPVITTSYHHQLSSPVISYTTPIIMYLHTPPPLVLPICRHFPGIHADYPTPRLDCLHICVCNSLWYVAAQFNNIVNYVRFYVC